MHATLRIASAIERVGDAAGSRSSGGGATIPRAAGNLPFTLKALDETIRIRNPAVISVDLFDTLLLRGSEPQRSRWLSAARRAEITLKRQGLKAPATAILAARLTSTRAAMAMTSLFGGPEDVTLKSIFALTTTALGLPPGALVALQEAELAEERARLTPNTQLIDVLASHRANRRIVVTSDTNFSAAGLASLLDCFGTKLQFDTIRTSADLGLTKQNGTIFPALLNLEGIHESRILHIGDDEIADVQMPSRHGIAPFHLPRPRGQLFVRRTRKYMTKVIHGDR